MKNTTHISSSLFGASPSPLRHSARTFLLARAMLVLLLSAPSIAFAGSATWNLNPVSGNWTTKANWTPNTVPNGPSDTATFDVSNTTDVSLSADRLLEVSGIVFHPGASAFAIDIRNGDLFMSGIGITNNSGIMQNFVAAVGSIHFGNNATAGNMTSFNNNGGFIGFGGTASAGNGIFITSKSGGNGSTVFFDTSTAGDGTFTNKGGGGTVFLDSSSAGNARLIANGGSGGNAGGSIYFFQHSSGSTARVEVFGNGNLDISLLSARGVTVGSIEGDGDVFLGARNLTVGSNNLSTNFSGVISDRGGLTDARGGSLTKIGTGKLVLSHRNTYPGGTTVNRGRLIVNTRGRSGTGSGPVQVNRGRLGGMGTIAGAVTVGTGSGLGAVLSPGYHHGSNPGTLTIQSPLTFNADATYEIEVNSSSATADEVVAPGVTINSGAQISFSDLGSATLPAGIVFTVINNTAATPIAGMFSNLPDGSTFTSNGTSFKADYQGGDGNDLTLTVVP